MKPKKKDLVCDIQYEPDGKGKVGKALMDSVTRETYDYLVNKGIQSERKRVCEIIDKQIEKEKIEATRYVIPLLEELLAKINSEKP